MKLHANARTCPNSRKLLVQRIEEEGWSASGPPASGCLAGGPRERRGCWIEAPRPSGFHPASLPIAWRQ